MDITSDAQFKEKLQALPIAQQRPIAALFVESVLDLCDDKRVKNAVETAKRSDVSEDELAAVYKAAQTASTETFTKCGKDTDWGQQAAHFVAAASTACVIPTAQVMVEKCEVACNAAMHSRMAKTCSAVVNSDFSGSAEIEKQYQILSTYLTQ